MANIVGTNRQSKCLYCNSTSYGSGCPYSPHKLHVHIDDSQRCIYCSSQSVGLGCPYNPFSKMHVRGVEFNTMLKENVYNTFVASLFLARLTESITEMECYRLGLIDEYGCIIREASSKEEISAFTAIDKYILKMKRLVGEDMISLFKSNALLESLAERSPDSFDSEQYTKEIDLQHKASVLVDNMFDLFSESVHDGISAETVENLIIESILKKYDDSTNTP